MKAIKEQLYFNCDMLEFEVKNIKENIHFDYYWIDIIRNLDFDNTNNAFFEYYWHTFTYRPAIFKWGFDWLIFTSVFDGYAIDLFGFRFSKQCFGGKQDTKEIVIFYSSFFILEKLNKLNFTIENFFNTFFDDYCKLHRIDICIDIPTTIEQLKTTIFKDTEFFSKMWIDKKNPLFHQTYYIKNPRTSENRSYLIRIYDKVLDTWKKWKQFLYPHLKNNNDVRRIELELRPKECELYNKYKITDFITNKGNILQKLFCKYLNKNIPNEKYKFISWEIEYTPHTNNKYDLKDIYLEYWHIPDTYLTRAYWYFKNIKEKTWYKGLFDVILWVRKEKQPLIWEEKIVYNNQNINNWYEFLDEFLNYLYSSWLSHRKLNQILKKHIKTIKIKKQNLKI